MTKKNVHTVPSKSGSGWDNTAGGAVVSHHHKKATAVEKGRSTARANESEHVIHGKDGKIQQSNSYGNDPNPPKDRR